MKARITASLVKSASAYGERLYVYDTEVKGFGLLVTPGGAKSYFVQYRPRPGGRSAPRRRHRIGPHGAPSTPDAARREALRLLGLVQDGRDPAADRRAARAEASDTLGRLVDLYVDQHARPNQRSWRETRRILVDHVADVLGDKPVRDICAVDVEAMLARAAERGPSVPRAAFAQLRALYNWAGRRGLANANPCDAVKPPNGLLARERALSLDEARLVLRAARALPYPWGPWFELLLLTGQRRGEVAGMQWDELEFTGQPAWTIPRERAKTARPHVVPLSAAAVEALARCPRQSPLVFTSTRRTPVSGFDKAKARLDEKAAQLAAGDGSCTPAPWRLHDLRRTMVTRMAEDLQVSPFVADRVIGHAHGLVNGVAAVYQRADYRRAATEALEAWARLLSD